MEIYIKSIIDFSEKDFRKYFEMMDDKRKNAIKRLRFPKDKKRSIMGEALARQGISLKCGMDEQEIRFSREESGKPFCENANIHFNISHSKDMVVCAISDNKIGVDIEKIRSLETRITRIACTENDLLYVFGSTNIPKTFDSQSLMRFFYLWTAKEAYFKYCGTGIVCLKEVSYEDIKENCQTQFHGEYIITVYEK